MLKNSEQNSKLFINIVSENNMPQIGSVSYFIESLGSVIGILDLISSLGGVNILLGVPFSLLF
jgi:hypothetical protein